MIRRSYLSGMRVVVSGRARRSFGAATGETCRPPRTVAAVPDALTGVGWRPAAARPGDGPGFWAQRSPRLALGSDPRGMRFPKTGCRWCRVDKSPSYRGGLGSSHQTCRLFCPILGAIWPKSAPKSPEAPISQRACPWIDPELPLST